MDMVFTTGATSDRLNPTPSERAMQEQFLMPFSTGDGHFVNTGSQQPT